MHLVTCVIANAVIILNVDLGMIFTSSQSEIAFHVLFWLYVVCLLILQENFPQ